MSSHQISKIEKFITDISESEEYLSIEYLVFNIRRLYLDYLYSFCTRPFNMPEYLKPLVKIISITFFESGINADDLLDFMLENDSNGWVYSYDKVYLHPYNSENNSNVLKIKSELFFMIVAGFIFDFLRDTKIDLKRIVNNEKFIYETNNYGLTKVNGVEFRKDYFIYDNKAYLYNRLTNTSLIDYFDEMPGFAKIITKQEHIGDILLRVDERLALPLDQAISYSTLNSEKFFGQSFHFKNSTFENVKTFIIHFDPKTSDKLLFVIKKDYDSIKNKNFMHIEIETLFNPDKKFNYSTNTTIFLHGMYYPDDDCFTHIDYTLNQYPDNIYNQKFIGSDIPFDFYAEKSLHYKIWCIENGIYSRETWYKLMTISLPKNFVKLLDEILT